MLNPNAEFTSSGTPGTRGTCPVCGTTMFRMGKTPAHEGMVAPPRVPRKKKEIKRKGKLVIVESPAKARTIERYLGEGYKVEASVGHVRDLLRSQLSVDVDNSFEPKYRVPNEKRPIVKELKAKAARAEEVFLATDLDREGEAIAWHLLEAAEIEPELAKRVVFNEITKDAVKKAFDNPREINMNLVDAQQARRILDRLVGYSLTPILWEKVRNRLSAGRVQSVAMRLIVEREREIDDFIPKEYWSVEADFNTASQDLYRAKLAKIDGVDPELVSKEQVQPLLAELQSTDFHVSAIKRGKRRRKPRAPFTTSTMQQESSRKLNFTARKAMSIAQQLYEGIDLGEGENTGLITYMRTDSTNISPVAQAEVRDYVASEHGEEFLPEEAPVYKTRSKRAEEAHEAIRPSSVQRTPKALKESLSRDQYRLYQLIWRRFVASQMKPAEYDTISVQILGAGEEHEYLFRASGSILVFQGYLLVYEESLQESGEDEGKNGSKIPASLEENQRQEMIELHPEQHFTQPPPRFSEATLVRSLEEFGIGRPSTYAATINTLQQRGYVYRDGRRLYPNDVAMLVNDLLVEHFPQIVDINFTAEMENDLDRIANGEEEWKDVIREFYGPFSEKLERAKIEMPETKAEPELVGRTCPTCNEGDLIIKWGRYGRFIGCSNFPDCRHTEPFLEKIGVLCPLDGGDVVERRTRKGRTFYGCSHYPECEFTSWKKPIATPCPNCKGTLVLSTKRFAQCLDCENQYPVEEVQPEEVPESA